MAYVLAIDFGTSGCRSAIYDENLRMLHAAIAEYPLIVLSEKEIDILVTLGDGDGTATAWGCDLTYDYVKINGDYRT